MASEFLQMVVVVELRNPPERLHGSVTGVEAGQSLTLSNVWSLNHHTWHPHIVVDPANIVEIFDASKDPSYSFPPPSTVSARPSVPGPVPAVASQPAIKAATPVLGDPAILSFRHRSDRPGSGLGQVRSASKPQFAPTDDASLQAPLQSVSNIHMQGSSRNATPISSRQTTLNDLHPPKGSALAIPDTSAATGNVAGMLVTTQSTPLQDGPPKTRRRQRPQRGVRNSQANESVDLTSERPKHPGKGNGWRETPILQSTASFQPFKSLKKAGQRHQRSNQDNCWASEDVTDVQELGDFDFEQSLAKFDKQTLFDQMRKDDQIDDADRLVTHNRKSAPKPGTAGGKNYHHTENVLDTTTLSAVLAPKILTKEPQSVSQDFWNSEADDTHVVGTGASGVGGGVGGGDRQSGREFGSRQGSRRGDSKVSTTRRSQSRKASSGTVGQGPSKINSVARRLETVSALQMLNLENIAHNELGLTEDMMAENAGRGIADVALGTLSDPANKIRQGQTDTPGMGLSASQTLNAPVTTIVILAGNNKSGTRAVACGRHLRNKGINVLLCVVGIERGERELLDDLRQQVRLYRNFGGRIYSKSDLFEHLRKIAVPTLTIDTPRNSATAKAPVVTLIIDALLGLVVSFDELRTGDQATVYELMEWANRNEAFVLAVDVPTGIDPSSGYVSIIDGSRLYVRPRYVVALGAPKRGLLEAMTAAEMGDPAAGEATVADDQALDWRLFLADIGLGAAVWKKAGTKLRRGVDFDDKWVLEMKYQGLETDADSD
ncbi:enhancer of mRNA decapping [Sporothrix eucalyptigena]|uniref:Enhancer of mRNA-decapping protein 3 n=1 Tax=Sporothrix eucalyptigena TaxID=1812306 RepID=A0ABP0B159_9PEZI